MEFLSVTQVQARADEVQEALTAALGVSAVAGHPHARQWQFLRACLEHVLGKDGDRAVWDDLSAKQAAQYKFEIQEKLRAHYERRAGQPGLALALVHARHLSAYRLAGAQDYPRLASYCLLVREPQKDATLRPQTDGWRDYLARVVTEAAEGEYRACEAIPELDERALERWSWPDGPFRREIVQRLRQRRGEGWTLSNAYNPSTHRTERVDVHRVDDTEALVSTREHWHLRWWSTRTDEYIYSYEEHVRFEYLVRRRNHAWRVWERRRRVARIPKRRPTTPLP